MIVIIKTVVSGLVFLVEGVSRPLSITPCHAHGLQVEPFLRFC